MTPTDSGWEDPICEWVDTTTPLLCQCRWSRPRPRSCVSRSWQPPTGSVQGTEYSPVTTLTLDKHDPKSTFFLRRIRVPLEMGPLGMWYYFWTSTSTRTLLVHLLSTNMGHGQPPSTGPHSDLRPRSRPGRHLGRLRSGRPSRLPRSVDAPRVPDPSDVVPRPPPPLPTSIRPCLHRRSGTSTPDGTTKIGDQSP